MLSGILHSKRSGEVITAIMRIPVRICQLAVGSSQTKGASIENRQVLTQFDESGENISLTSCFFL